MKIFKTNFAVPVLIIILFSCKQAPQIKWPEYSTAPSSKTALVYQFAVHPLYNPTKLNKAYQPLINYLNSKFNQVQFSLEASRDYANFEKKYLEHKPEFILPNPWQTIQAMKEGYNVIAMAGEKKDFKGIFIVRKDGGIRKPSDLKGKAVSYPSSTALAACIMPQYFLYEHGININKDIKNLYVGSQESSIMNVYMKNSVAGVTWPPPWRDFQKSHPEEASELKVLWATDPLINNSVMIRNDIPAWIQEKIKKYLTELNTTEEGKAILAGMETARFIAASNKDYDIIRLYTKRFEKKVRMIETK